jgi:hypothetical protein
MTPSEHTPSFVYVGGSKCGSSWLYEILRENPEVFVPDAKDVMYFDRHLEKPFSWYCSFFEASGEKHRAIGELTHDYFLDPAVAERIYQHLPDAKILACLREPSDRTISRWIYERSIRLKSDVTFSDFMTRRSTLVENDYLNNLEPYYRLFPKDRILVLLYDDIVESPGKVARQIYSFLGVNEEFVPPSLNRRVLPARVARFEPLAHFAYFAAQLMRKAGSANMVGAVKRRSWFEKLLYQPLRKRPHIASEDIAWIKKRFADSYGRLGALIGKEIPTSWYPEA